MRLLHTSDWHLGRSFGPASLHDDQAAFVEWFADFAVAEAVDLVVIAGDVYDRAVPPTRSIDLVRSALLRLQRAGIQVVVVTGNHDGAERVAAYDGLLDATGVQIRGGYTRAGEVLRLTFADGPLDVVAVPFLDPVLAPADAAGELLPGMRRPTHHTVAAGALARARAAGVGPRSLAVAHAFVVGGDIAPYVSDSERELAVGGTGAVDVALFAGFSYTALGHLHAPQEVGGATVRYCGSPLAYSFSETRAKQVVLVDVSSDGTATPTAVEVPVGRRVRTITGTIADLVAAPRADAVPCFVRAVLTDPGAVLDAKARLQAVYPHVVEVELRPAARPGDEPRIPVHLRRRLAPVEAAVEFWRDVHAFEPDEARRELLERGLSEVLG
jgi:exonuclease SbcD